MVKITHPNPVCVLNRGEPQVFTKILSHSASLILTVKFVPLFASLGLREFLYLGQVLSLIRPEPHGVCV